MTKRSERKFKGYAQYLVRYAKRSPSAEARRIWLALAQAAYELAGEVFTHPLA